MIQLMRTHSLLGDYYLAMKSIEDIDFQAEVPLYYKTSASHITLFYYMGFAYLMLRRYRDAIKTFSGILITVSKTAGMHTLSIQSGFLMKKHDQIFSLLLICQALCPEQLDEFLERTIREKHQEKQDRLFRGEELCFEELFAYACPKFVTAALPESLENFNQNEAHQRQSHLFLQDVRQQKFLPTIRSYMKLYTSIKVTKLAQLCEMDEEGVRDQLLCVVHKTRQNVRSPGKSPLSGEIRMCSEVEFIIDGDTVHIASQQPSRPMSDVFLEHIGKFQDILRKLEM
jgi:translation initiation factor 3 subunit L